MKVLKNQYLERKVCPLFHMKTTDSKNLVKVNQILPIMQEHFGNSNLFQEQRMNKECFATSNLNKQQTIVAFLNKNRDLCDKLIS